MKKDQKTKNSKFNKTSIKEPIKQSDLNMAAKKTVKKSIKTGSDNRAVKRQINPHDSQCREDINLDIFLIDEQNNCPKNPTSQAVSEKQLSTTELDQLIFGVNRTHGQSNSVRQHHLKIGFNKFGDTLKEKTPHFSGSVHQVDLKQPFFRSSNNNQINKAAGENKSNPLNEFKIDNYSLQPPKARLDLKSTFNRWKTWCRKFFGRSYSGAEIFSSQTKSASLGVLLNIKTALNFALIALLLILPIRTAFFYQHVQATKGQVLGVSEMALGDFKLGAKAAEQADWQEAGHYFNEAGQRFSLAQQDLLSFNKILIGLSKNLPASVNFIGAGESLLSAGQHLAKAGQDFSVIIEQLNSTADIKSAITDKLALIAEALAASKQEILAASEDIAAVNPKILPPNEADYFVQIQQQLPQLLVNFNDVQELLDFSLDFLGNDSTKRYLFLFQNNNELRATGGFLGSAALVDIKGGQIVNLEVPGGGLYDLKGGFFEKVISPEPLHLLGTPWMIWDANWWPDFSLSAKKIIWFWEKSNWPSVDGVIAFNASLMPKLLEIVGDISLPEYNQTLTPASVVVALQHEVEFEYDKAKNQPKKIISDAMPILIEKIMSVPANESLPLLLTLNSALRSKEIQFYFPDEKLQGYINIKQWGGAVLPTGGDYLMVVNQNIAGGKSDAVISQQIKHYAYLQPDGYIVDTVAITRTHNGRTEDVFEKVQNNSYLRIYVPKGSQLLEVTGNDVIDPALFKEVYDGYHQDEDVIKYNGEILKDEKTNTDIYSELDKTVFGNWLQIKPGESKTITFSYRLPFSLNFTNNGWFNKNDFQKYSLLIQSQSGSQQVEFSSQLFYPKNLQVKWQSSTDPSLAAGENSIKLLTTLDRDHYYGVVFSH